MNNIERLFAPREETLSVQPLLLKDTLLGLIQALKTLPAKYLYDERGSELYDLICDQEEYYLTSAEFEILTHSLGEVLHEMNPLRSPMNVLEPGSGASRKTRLLLKHLPEQSSYFLMDISKPLLLKAAEELRTNFPQILIETLPGDFTRTEDLLRVETLLAAETQKLIFFPGSTIGNFTPTEVLRILSRFHNLLATDGHLLIGVDLIKDASILERAYNDQAGLTAEFNLNVLRRLNRELNTDFPIHYFRHQAFFNKKQSRIEMHLICDRSCIVRLNGFPIRFSQGESIHTESSYKYSIDHFRRLASRSGFEVRKIYTDRKDYFGVFLLKAV